MSGFTLTKGSAVGSGGVWSEPSGIVTNCTLTGNRCHSITPCGGNGGGAMGGTLYNCTLTGNSSDNFGGGAGYNTLYNCTLTDNIASEGGGALGSALYNCTLTANSVYEGGEGGGAFDCTLYNCTLTANSVYASAAYNCVITGNSGSSDGAFYNCTVVENGGGISGTAFNSIVYYNFGGNYGEGTTLNYCCTTPLPTNGVGNITGPPLFMDMAAGDFRLREESPCIDAGTNVMGFPMMGMDVYDDWMILGHITDPTDLLGNTRFIDGNFDGTVAWDIGAYEFNSFRPPRFSMAPQLTPDGWKLNITGAPNKWVHVQRSSDLKNWEDVWSGWMGADGVHQCTDADMGQKVMFYRVVVE